MTWELAAQQLLANTVSALLAYVQDGSWFDFALLLWTQTPHQPANDWLVLGSDAVHTLSVLLYCCTCAGTSAKP
jgi:hypothetical protein